MKDETYIKHDVNLFDRFIRTMLHNNSISFNLNTHIRMNKSIDLNKCCWYTNTIRMKSFFECSTNFILISYINTKVIKENIQSVGKYMMYDTNTNIRTRTTSVN